MVWTYPVDVISDQGISQRYVSRCVHHTTIHWMIKWQLIWSATNASTLKIFSPLISIVIIIRNPAREILVWWHLFHDWVIHLYCDLSKRKNETLRLNDKKARIVNGRHTRNKRMSTKRKWYDYDNQDSCGSHFRLHVNEYTYLVHELQSETSFPSLSKRTTCHDTWWFYVTTCYMSFHYSVLSGIDQTTIWHDPNPGHCLFVQVCRGKRVKRNFTICQLTCTWRKLQCLTLKCSWWDIHSLRLTYLHDFFYSTHIFSLFFKILKDSFIFCFVIEHIFNYPKHDSIVKCKITAELEWIVKSLFLVTLQGSKDFQTWSTDFST